MGTVKKIAAFSAAALPAVVVARAVRAGKKLPEVPPAVTYTDEERDRYALNLSEMIKVPTVSRKQEDSWEDFAVFQEKLAGLFPLVFSKLEVHDVDGNLLRRLPGKDPSAPARLYMGHQDVVPVDQADWTRDPFSGAIEDGCIHGRGAMDCKSTMCCELSALEELLSEGFEPEGDIWISASRNEEISGGGAEAAVGYLKERGVRLSMVMDEGGAIVEGILPGLKHPCAAVGIVEKGFVNLKFTAVSKGGHSSTPPKNSPLVQLSKFMAEVDRKQPFRAELSEPIPGMFEAVTPYMTLPLRIPLANMWLFKGLMKTALSKISGQTRAFVQSTAAFTMAGGSTQANVLPDEAYVICNLRPSVHQNADETIAVIKKIADKYGIKTEVLFKRDASGISSADTEEFRKLKKCLSDCLPDSVVIPYLMTGGTDSRQYEEICDCVYRICPTRLTGPQLAAMHAANENIGIDALAEGVKIYKYIMSNM